MVRPTAVTTVQNCWVGGAISPAAEAAARTMRVVSEGEAIRKPVSAATDLRAPPRRSRPPVTAALISTTPAMARTMPLQLARIAPRSRLMPIVIRKTPSARPRNGAVITSTSLE